MLRRWLGAQRMAASGMKPYEIAPKVLMWGRDRELDALLRRLPPQRLRSLLARLAALDAQAKVGARTIEMGVEEILLKVSGAA
jgi:hypothetical protein